MHASMPTSGFQRCQGLYYRVRLSSCIFLQSFPLPKGGREKVEGFGNPYLLRYFYLAGEERSYPNPVCANRESSCRLPPYPPQAEGRGGKGDGVAGGKRHRSSIQCDPEACARGYTVFANGIGIRGTASLCLRSCRARSGAPHQMANHRRSVMTIFSDRC